MEVINALEAHKKKAEFDGNYVEARAATQRLNGVKVLFHGTRATSTLSCMRCSCHAMFRNFSMIHSGYVCRSWKIIRGRESWSKDTKSKEKNLKKHINKKCLKEIEYVK